MIINEDVLNDQDPFIRDNGDKIDDNGVVLWSQIWRKIIHKPSYIYSITYRQVAKNQLF